jgi:hypothetical protein
MQESPNKNSEYKDYGTSKRSKTLIDIGRDSAAVKGTKSEKKQKGTALQEKGPREKNRIRKGKSKRETEIQTARNQRSTTFGKKSTVIGESMKAPHAPPEKERKVLNLPASEL